MTAVRSRALLLLAGLAVSAALGEAAVRVAVRLTGRFPLVESDAVLGWALRSNLRDRRKVEPQGEFRISTDGAGHRRTRPESAARPAGSAIVLVGDSFVQGQGVDDVDTFAWRLEAAAGRPVVNLGVLGYGTDQELLSLRAYLAAHPAEPVGDVVVLAFENDFEEVQQSYRHYLGMSKPRFELRGARLALPPFRPPLADRLMLRSQLFWLVKTKLDAIFPPPRPEAPRGIELVVAELREICAAAAARGARCHLLAHRRLTLERFAAADWRRFLVLSGAEDITELIRSPAVPDPIGYDGAHWSAEGHRRVAAVVESRLR